MRKYLILIILLAGFQTELLSQNTEQIKRDSLKIDSLQKRLLKLTDTARINCLLNIADAFFERADYKIKRKVDSGRIYVNVAANESTKISFLYGATKAKWFDCWCHKQMCFQNRNTQVDNTTNMAEWEIKLKKLFELAGQLNDAEMWGHTYANQSDFLEWKKKKDESLVALEKSLEWFKKAGNERSIAEISTVIGYRHTENGISKRALIITKMLCRFQKK